jgi:hypothetical protein
VKRRPGPKRPARWPCKEKFPVWMLYACRVTIGRAFRRRATRPLGCVSDGQTHDDPQNRRAVRIFECLIAVGSALHHECNILASSVPVFLYEHAMKPWMWRERVVRPLRGRLFPVLALVRRVHPTCEHFHLLASTVSHNLIPASVIVGRVPPLRPFPAHLQGATNLSELLKEISHPSMPPRLDSIYAVMHTV